MIGTIYKLTNTIDDRIYVGSTENCNKRMKMHKSMAHNVNANSYTMPLYICMRELGRDKFSISCLETIEYDDKKDLLYKEREWIERLKPSLNKISPITSTQEKKEYVKKWHTDNKEHVKDYKKQLYRDNKKKFNDKHKTYYNEHKEHIKAKTKEYALTVPKITCGFGSIYTAY